LIDVNRAADVIPTLEHVLTQAAETHLGFKHEAVARYNLGLAYLNEGGEGEAVEQFDAVMSLWPGSRYAERAKPALSGRCRARPADSAKP